MESQRHVVVFDCNVYLDVARLVEGPFTWSAFNDLAARHQGEPVPAGSGAIDSLRAIALTLSGRFAGREPIEVWTCDHIEQVVVFKAMQPLDGEPGASGLGLSREHAELLVDHLIWGSVNESGGDSLGDPYPDGTPPLDHEDGKVFGACRALAGEDPLAQVYCVTNDRGFVTDYKAGRLGRHVRVLPPAVFVTLVRRARTQAAIRSMPRP